MLRFGRGAGMPWPSRQCATTTSSSSSTTSSSLDDAAAQTIAMLRQHPGLLKEVQRRRGAEAPSTGNIAPVGRTAHERAFAAADSDGDGQLSKGMPYRARTPDEQTGSHTGLLLTRLSLALDR
tara:strand:+ start:172 stop:540 length:369 start_codon:yes stop_codon:yes gene_type:complete